MKTTEKIMATHQLKNSVTDNMRPMLSSTTLIVWASILMIAILTGPFGTFGMMEFPARLIYWSFIVTTSMIVGYFARGVAIAVIGQDRPFLFDAFATGLITVLLTPTVLVFGMLMQRSTYVPLPHLLIIAFYVFAISAAIFVLRRILLGTELHTYPFLENTTSSCSKPRLLERVASEIEGEVLRISGKNHRVEVVTEHGTTTLRLRLSDAVQEMAGIYGFFVHRSHWVARTAIAEVVRENSQKVSIVLTNGDILPVSRKYREHLCNLDLK